jgi:CheY-like chemotaxis protein
MELSFIIIDDTELDHFIAKKVIGNAYKLFSVKSFIDGYQALEYIITDDIDKNIRLTIVFLDIYMPGMNGFQFIEEFEKLDQAIKDKYYIVALTSSREIADINRINSYASFKAMIIKPITVNQLSVLLNAVAKEFGIQLM